MEFSRIIKLIDASWRRKPGGIMLDMDSSLSETHGHQEGSAYNGQFGSTCYHPAFCFNQYGDPERALLHHGMSAAPMTGDVFWNRWSPVTERLCRK